MRDRPSLRWLVPLIALLASLAAVAGLAWVGEGGAVAVTTPRGLEATLHGRGLYRWDTLFTAAAFRGTDVVTLLAALPLLALSWSRSRHGSLKGRLVLTGALAYFLYNGASMALSAAYNPLFLVYVALLSASLYAFVLALTSVDAEALARRATDRLPHRATAWFLAFAGVVTLVVWLSEIVAGLPAGDPPELMGAYTTLVTHALDMAVIVPACLIAAVSLSRRHPRGYLLAPPLLILLVLIGLVVVAQTIAQLSAGVAFDGGTVAVFVGSWIALAAVALWITLRFFGGLRDGPTPAEPVPVP